ncbi:hypothetical protein LEP1GSC188_3336 [Leptospira weilii serovar Topaz str. LT2116]|uniref:Uncharacterized protein n=1 Tax=Leptospira weilii serovar Topaz str. LT2116 TaxID=1088540 RepID=M3G871_9LEPT|nr:hypothetical protein LEP1GSC188_3336 [Leptospira weilii serovar Topaz str. LT2116]
MIGFNDVEPQSSKYLTQNHSDLIKISADRCNCSYVLRQTLKFQKTPSGPMIDYEFTE